MANEDKPTSEEKRQWEVWDKRVRDSALFLLGIAATINELWFVTEPRPLALPVIGGLLGLPFALRADEKRREGG
jgi:hypothetical protein